MFAQSKTQRQKSGQGAAKQFFGENSASQSHSAFFNVPPAIQKKCATCEEEEKIQTKLTIGQPDDQYEREADAVADRVVNSSTVDVQRQALGEEEETIQAKAISGFANPDIQRQPEQQEEEEILQTKEQTSLPASVSTDIGSALKSSQGGQTIPVATRHFFESRIGHDFSDVKIHNDTRAHHLARSVNARAFTHGQDVYFNSGEYQPQSREGKHLLAHELTHVVQQRGANSGSDINTKRAVPTLKTHTARIQRVLGPPYPFPAIVTTRWQAAFRRTPNMAAGNIIAGLPRNTRITAIANSGNWLEVRAVIDGQIQTGFIYHNLVGHAAAAGFAPAVTAGGRVEVTAFGTYNVYSNVHSTALQPNEIYSSEFKRLEKAWTRVNDNSGGLVINGAAGDVATLRAQIGVLMGQSQAFRNLIMEITEDAAHPVTVNVGTNNASWIDSFATNNVDLRDQNVLDAAPRPGNEWAPTQGGLIMHWLAERRHAAVHGGGFAPAHADTLGAGGLQEQFRSDLGQPGRIVSQVRSGPGGGLHEGIYTDDSGNIFRILRDGSGGDPVPYEIRYEPIGGGAVTTRRNRIVAEVRSNNPAAEDLYLNFTNVAHDVTSPTSNVSTGANLNFITPLGGIVPLGASMDVELFREGQWWMPDVLLGTVNWAHPFNDNATVIATGGFNYTVNTRLVMDA